MAHGTLYVQGLVLVAAVFAVVALSLDLVLGVTGMFSLAHAGLLGLGAYLTTVLWTSDGINVFLLLPVAIIGSGLLGLVIGAASLRVGGLQFAIVTLIFTLVFTTVVSNLSITGGAERAARPHPAGLAGRAELARLDAGLGGDDRAAGRDRRGVGHPPVAAVPGAARHQGRRPVR